MTIASNTPNPTDSMDLLATRRTRSRRHHGILSRHVPSCRIRGMGL